MTTTRQQDCQAFGSKAVRSTTMFLRFLFVFHLSDSIAHTRGSLIKRHQTCDLWPHEQSCQNNLMATLSAHWSQRRMSRTDSKRCVLNGSRSCETNYENTEIIIDDVFGNVISKISEFVHKNTDLRLFCGNKTAHYNAAKFCGMFFAAVSEIFNMTKVANRERKTVMDNVFGNLVNQFMMATERYMNSPFWLQSGTGVHANATNKQQGWSNAAALFYQRHMRSCATSAWGSTRHSESSSSQSVGGDLPWLKAVMTACKALLVKMWVCSLFLCVVDQIRLPLIV